MFDETHRDNVMRLVMAGMSATSERKAAAMMRVRELEGRQRQTEMDLASARADLAVASTAHDDYMGRIGAVGTSVTAAFEALDAAGGLAPKAAPAPQAAPGETPPPASQAAAGRPRRAGRR